MLLIDIISWLFPIALVLALHQYFLSITIFIIQKKKIAQRENILNDYVDFVNLAVAPRLRAKVVNKYVKFYVKLLSFCWVYVLPVVMIFFLLTIFVIISLMVIINGFWWFAIYYFILLIDIIVLVRIDKNILRNTHIDRLWFFFPGICYPKKVLNFVFQPAWLIWIVLLILIISIVFKKQFLAI
ncbi:hypothetical protein B6D52_02050 [Candidatus Parcubacteria bacterium 4484_255]|nr:MAG: hypothetical protein B6D52_02050 [Candidatus Parcubacteria bacterium 4484_255]